MVLGLLSPSAFPWIITAAYLIFGNSSASYLGLMKNEQGRTTPMAFLKYSFQSFIYGTMTTTVTSYYTVRGIFSFFFAKQPTFPATPVDKVEPKPVLQALKNIGLETHMRAMSIGLIGLAQLWWLSLSNFADILNLPMLCSLTGIFSMITLPYFLDMVLMSSLWNKIKPKRPAGQAISTIVAQGNGRDQAQLTISAPENVTNVQSEVDFKKGGIDFSGWSMLERKGRVTPVNFNFSAQDLNGFQGFQFEIRKIAPIRLEHALQPTVGGP